MQPRRLWQPFALDLGDGAAGAEGGSRVLDEDLVDERGYCPVSACTAAVVTGIGRRGRAGAVASSSAAGGLW